MDFYDALISSKKENVLKNLDVNSVNLSAKYSFLGPVKKATINCNLAKKLPAPWSIIIIIFHFRNYLLDYYA